MTKQYEIRVNPADFSVLTSAVFTIAREMGLNMERTARAPIYFSAHDFCTSLLSLDAEVIALAEYIPVLTGATPFAVNAVRKYFGDDVGEGDVFLVNDPYTLDGGNQLADWCIVYPIFYQNEQILWVANKAHQQDTGGGAPGGYNPHAIDIYAEGLRIPPLRIYKAGRERRSVVNLIMTNVRIPDVQHSDLLSLIGAARVAEKRVRAVMDNYGRDIFKVFLEDLLAYGEFLMRAEIEKIPDGTYHSEIHGDVPEAPVIVCDMTVEGDELTVDFTNSGPMSREYINSPIANTYSSVYQAILQSLGKRFDVRCGGCYRPIHIRTTPGTITHATFPATHGNCTNFVAKQIIEAVWAALAQVLPHETPGGWGSIPYWVFSGVDPRRGEGYGSPDFLSCASGAGAMWGVDGWSTNGPVICSGTLYYPEMEVCESLYPILWERWEWATDSAGPGRWRGGLGVHNEWVANGGTQPIFVHYAADPYDYYAAPAIEGGQTPPPNRKELFLAEGRHVSNQEVRDSKAFVLTSGARVVDFVQGGCGVGDPLTREVEEVWKDVRDGLVSLESAERDYGVVIDSENFSVKQKETEDIRLKMKTNR
ncbi:putative N-methylhydantoinase B/acetone carboxylase, alpha subunit [uncultured Desulfatiglans sp.]|nr:putative N-methylhydantoinase B/acetone carboxylase, alpha subunit [uncultured Desulfatiglans sp.]